MKFTQAFVLTLLSIISIYMTDVDARYVTRASRDHVRHIRRKLERTYGHGLVGLIHPVTGEFNHEAVIYNRGGRFEHERLGNTKDIGLEWLINAGNHLVG